MVRPVFRLALAAAIASLTLFVTAHSPRDSIADSSGFIGVSGDGFVLDGQPFVLKGFNYYPRNYGWATMSEWDWTQVDQELALASAVGANTVRVMVDYGYSTGHPEEVWSEDDVQHFQTATPEYVEAMQRLLSIADSHGLKVIFGLFDYAPGWSFIGRADYAPGENYLQTLVPAFADDPRVAAWSVFNEGDFTPERFPYVSLDSVVQFNRAMANAIRPLDQNHLVTADFGRVWNAHLAQGFADFLSFHYYADPAALPDQIQALRARLDRPMPIILGELGSPSEGGQLASVTGQTLAMGEYLDTALWGQQPLAGALVWDLVDQNQPRTQLNRQGDKGGLKLGIWDGNLQPRPAAGVVERYFSGGCGPGQRVELRFPNAPTEPPPNSGRVLQVGMRQLTLLRSDGSPISQVQFGTLEANLVEGSGWYLNEDWGQWAGQPNRTASLCFAALDDVSAVRIHAQAIRPDTVLEVWIQGVMQGAMTLQTTESEQTITLSQKD